MYKESLKKPIFLWSLANIFFAFQFILRLSAGILREEITQKFAITVSEFGTLSGYYYLGYAGSQIPLGIMLDRLSFRFVTSIAIATASIGTLMFVITDDWNILLLGRFLIGVGSGTAFLSVAKIVTTCFEEKYHSMLIGFSFTFGLIGAVFGTTPMQILFDKFGYDLSFNVLAIIGFSIAFIILIFGKIDNKQVEDTTARDTINSVIKLMINPKILIIGISGGLMVGALEGFGDVWGIAFFNHVFGMTKNESTAIISFIYTGMCFGGPILAFTANIFRSANIVIFFTGLLTTLVFIILFYSTHMSFATASALMFCLGILCCYQVLVFTIVSNQVSASSAGLAIAVTNCINMSFGNFFHKAIASIFEKNWDGAINESGGALYSSETFIYALSVIPICCFIGQFGFVFLAMCGRKKTK